LIDLVTAYTAEVIALRVKEDPLQSFASCLNVRSVAWTKQRIDRI
jgi:hypothetical protein